MSRNLHDYASQTNRRLVIGVLLILFTIGLGLIWWIYGRDAAALGFICLLGAFIPIGLIIFIIFGLDYYLKKSKRD